MCMYNKIMELTKQKDNSKKNENPSRQVRTETCGTALQPTRSYPVLESFIHRQIYSNMTHAV